MSLKYKFDKLNERNKSLQESNDAQKDVEHYETPVPVRSLDLVDVKGKHFSFNYAYLMTGEYARGENKITLFFNTHEASITGRNLETLFADLMVHKISMIVCSDKRYASVKGENEIFVEEVLIKQNL